MIDQIAFICITQYAEIEIRKKYEKNDRKLLKIIYHVECNIKNIKLRHGSPSTFPDNCIRSS